MYTTRVIKTANKLVDTEYAVTNYQRNDLWRKGLGKEFFLLNQHIFLTNRNSKVWDDRCPSKWNPSLPIEVLLVEAQDYLEQNESQDWMKIFMSNRSFTPSTERTSPVKNRTDHLNIVVVLLSRKKKK